MNIALVGCGFVADHHLATLSPHPELGVVGVHDRLAERTAVPSAAYGVHGDDSIDALVGDARVDMVLNLTNPREHHAVSRAALLAGERVYSEKPLAKVLCAGGRR